MGPPTAHIPGTASKYSSEASNGHGASKGPEASNGHGASKGPEASKDHGASKDFYKWVNTEWEKKARIPNSESDYGVSEEVEHCIYNKSLEIIKESNIPLLHNLKTSCLDNNVQDNSVVFLKGILHSLNFINTTDDVFSHFAYLCKSKFYSIFTLQYHIEPDKNVSICIDGASPGLYLAYYKDHNIMNHYATLMKKLEDSFDTPLSKSFNLERTLVMKSEELYNENRCKIKGTKLVRKFPKIPWKLWFSINGIEGWEKRNFYYTSPRWIRYIGNTIHNVPIDYWKIYLARCYIINSLKYLPSPYSDWDYDFFGKAIVGQEKKTPREDILVNIVYDYLHDFFSKLFWEKAGEPELVPEIREFTNCLVESAKHRIRMTEWMKPETRNYAVKKVDSMLLQTVRPHEWAPHHKIELDSKNLLKNIFILGEMNVRNMISRLGKKYTFWEEGLYRVNAYYFNESNEIMIPYGTCISPFYISSKDSKSSLGWNYGGLGGIIGHEMCHAFDNEGREYSECGEKENWWSRSDNMAYRHKAKLLIRSFSKQSIDNIHIDGFRTLSENIADLGGVGIALHALKEKLNELEIFDVASVKEEYKKFFISFATSWRTKYRSKKLKSSLGHDVHAPAFLRVNMVVPQFDEWYEAFDVKKGDDMYIEPEHRIKIF